MLILHALVPGEESMLIEENNNQVYEAHASSLITHVSVDVLCKKFEVKFDFQAVRVLP